MKDFNIDYSKKLIEELCNAGGIPGFEGPVAEIYRNHLKDIIETKTDYMGNVTGSLKGASNSPKIMLCAHMDEIGMVVQSVMEDGRIKFIMNGSWWKNLMLQQPVNIITSKGDIPGLVSSTSSFFIKPDDLSKFEAKEAMFIDIGARSREEALNFGVMPGNPVVFDSPFRAMANPEVFTGKAFDNRLGIAVIIEVTRYLFNNKKHPNTIFPVATVQEEIGSRGALAATKSCQPDIAIIIEGPPSDDIPLKKYQSQCILGKGPHIRRMEPGMVSSPGLYKIFIEVAEELGIPHQPAVAEFGGTDGAIIHKEELGIPSIMLGIPVRYAHGHHSIFFLEDYVNTVKLVIEVILRINVKKLKYIRENPYG